MIILSLFKGKSLTAFGGLFFVCHSIGQKLLLLTERVHLLLKFRFHVKFFDFRVSVQYL
jgi:hypothetical protein